jgi:hypothetical protein
MLSKSTALVIAMNYQRDIEIPLSLKGNRVILSGHVPLGNAALRIKHLASWKAVPWSLPVQNRRNLT